MFIPEFIKEYLNKCIDVNGILSPSKLNKYITPELKEWISQYPDYKWIHIYHLIKLGLDDIPLCPVCGSKVFNFYKGKRFCSSKCSMQSDEIKNKMKSTMKERYGVEYPAQSKLLQEKMKKTCLKNLGVEYPSQSNKVKEKIKTTNLERYGVDNPWKSKEIQNKIKTTNLERYGVEIPIQNKNISNKMKYTIIERYGVDNPLKSKEIQNKIKTTNLERYGVEWSLQSKEVRDKIKQTNVERYGVENVWSSKEIKDKIKKELKNNRYGLIFKFFEESTNIELLSSKEEFINSEQIRYKCKLCGTEFYLNTSSLQRIVCPNHCLLIKSNKELEVKSFIQSILPNTEIISNNRKLLYPLELDIYIPEKNLAIEFNGDYWHSSQYKDKNYHLEKTLKCQENGIRLIHIFEHEWDFKRPIAESILRNALGSIENRIYARKTIVKELTSKEYSNFLELNHIQGSIVSKYRYGLFYQNELVSVIGFGSSRFKKGEIELHRFCSKLNTSVIGGFSKLIKHFMKQNICSEFITYVDRSKFDAKGYFKIGFELLNETEPSYFYSREEESLSRYQCQKHKLSKLLENYDPSLTETDNMILNGYLKVYDCGTLKLIYRK